MECCKNQLLELSIENLCWLFRSHLHISISCINIWIAKTNFWTCKCDVIKLFAELEAITWTSYLLRSLVSSRVTTVENCWVLNAQGRALSKSGNMKEGDRKLLTGNLWMEFWSKKLLVIHLFYVMSISCHSPFKTVSLLLKNSNLALNKFWIN